VHGWLAEFIIREDRAGSMGQIGPPIISRVMQFISDGMIFYNHCRKTMFIPFPFPHAQLSAFFNITMIIAVPLLMIEYSNKLWLSSVITLMTVTCLAGLHETSRELENPFRNIPNEIPLTTLQAMFNESLLTVYSGYHPDHYWNGDEYRTRAAMYGTPISGDGTPSSRRLRTPPISPLNSNRKMPNKTLSSHIEEESSNTSSTDLSSAEDQGIAICELQMLVTKQSNEIERLSGILESTSPSSVTDIW